jgi:hypothetical protein
MRGANGHGVSATPENVSRCRHDRFPHPGPLPEGEGIRSALRATFTVNISDPTIAMLQQPIVFG